MQFYKLLQDMPHHKAGELLVKTNTAYVWEIGSPHEQYALGAEIVENTPEWFEETFPNWVQNEQCWFLSFNGLVVRDYFDRNKHSAIARFGNLFKSAEDAEVMLEKVKQILQPFADA